MRPSCPKNPLTPDAARVFTNRVERGLDRRPRCVTRQTAADTQTGQTANQIRDRAKTNEWATRPHRTGPDAGRRRGKEKASGNNDQRERQQRKKQPAAPSGDRRHGTGTPAPVSAKKRERARAAKAGSARGCARRDRAAAERTKTNGREKHERRREQTTRRTMKTEATARLILSSVLCVYIYAVFCGIYLYMYVISVMIECCVYYRWASHSGIRNLLCGVGLSQTIYNLCLIYSRFVVKTRSSK